MRQPIVFTDLDGTLLDHASYSWEPAKRSLQILREKEIPVICCSSKTRAEIEFYRQQLDNRGPFISENGGGVFIPDGYFDLSVRPPNRPISHIQEFTVITLGTPYEQLRRALIELRAEGFQLTGFGDMSIDEIAELTGLPPEQAKMARERDFDEPFIFNGSEEQLERLFARVRAKSLHTTRGALFHLLGNNDKGQAVDLLSAMFREHYGEVTVVALGDSLNDLPMLQRADLPVAIRKADGHHEPAFALPHLIRTEGIGPVGWNEAILALFDDK